MKSSLFGTIRLFSYRDCQNCYYVFLYHSTSLLTNFHCDAIKRLSNFTGALRLNVRLDEVNGLTTVKAGVVL